MCCGRRPDGSVPRRRRSTVTASPSSAVRPSATLHLVRRVDLGRTAAHVDGLHGVPADQRDAGAGGERQDVVGVGQHGDARGGEPVQLLPALAGCPGSAGRLGSGRGCGVQRADPFGQPQDPGQVIVDDGLRRPRRPAPPATRASPHGPSGPGITRSRPPLAAGAGGLGGEPVGHDHPVETPFALDDLVLHVVLLGGGDTVDVVVGGHDRPRLGLLRRRSRTAAGTAPAASSRRRRCSSCSGPSRTRWRPGA